MPARHQITKTRNDFVMRALQVRAVRDITPRLRRVTLAGPELAGFQSAAPDDYVKLYFPSPERVRERPALEKGGEKIAKHGGLSKSRDYTTRRYDAAAQELDIEFVLHGDGPASTWAANAKPGDWLVAGGPKGSRIVPYDFDNYLLIGDATGLPAIARRLEELPLRANVITLIEVADAGEHQPLPSRAGVQRLWVHRGDTPAGENGGLLHALKQLPFPKGDTFVWGAGESRTMREVRKYLEERGHNEDWTRISGYWKLKGED